MSTLVLALSGTDHHPFDRMVSWLDSAAARRADVRFVVQHGAARAPQVAEGHDFLTRDEMGTLLASASVVICHGGPGTIMDAREAGHVPLCMPRDPRLGEHVDGHQQRFVAAVGKVGLVRPVTSLENLLDELDGSLLLAPHERAMASLDSARHAARALAARELDQQIARRPHRIARLHRAPLVSGRA